MNFAMDRNIDAFIGAENASDSASATAGGSGDATAATGIILDRLALGSPQSASFLTRYKTVLAANKTLSLGFVVKHGDAADLSDATAYLTVNTAVVASGGGAGATVRDVVRTPVDLSGAKQYIRIDVTPDLSATGTDTAEFSTVAVLGGQDNLPA